MAIFICGANGLERNESAEPLINPPAAWSATLAKYWLKLVTKDGWPLKPELIQLTTLRVIWSMAACATALIIHCQTPWLSALERCRFALKSHTSTAPLAIAAVPLTAVSTVPVMLLRAYCATQPAATIPSTSPDTCALGGWGVVEMRGIP